MRIVCLVVAAALTSGLFISKASSSTESGFSPLAVRVRTQKDLSFSKEQFSKLEKSRYQPEIKKNIKITYFERASGLFDEIKWVPFEDYLAGVVSREMPLTWPLEALKAQAVVARSYVLYQMLQRRDKHFDVDSNQMDQVFSFVDSPKAYQAVHLTEGVVIQTATGKLVKAYYHSDCGGETIPAPKVWAGTIDTGTAKDIWCEKRSKNRWDAFFTKAEISKGLSELAVSFSTDSITVEKIRQKVITVASIPVQKIRESLGFNVVRGSPTKVEITDEGIHFHGSGYGHGVGLCQWGTLAQVKEGRSYLEVLNHYYSKALVMMPAPSIKEIETKIASY